MRSPQVDRYLAVRSDPVALAVFADELSQAGDPRGEQLSLSRAIERMPRWLRAGSDEAFAAALLQARACRAWGVPQTVNDYVTLRMRGGLPTCVMGYAARLGSWTPSALVDALDLIVGAGDLAMLAVKPWLAQIDELRFRIANTSSPSPSELAALVKSISGRPLRRLDCALPAGASPALLLELLPGLADATLALQSGDAHPPVEARGVEELLSVPPRVKELSLRKAELSPRALAAVAAAPGLSRLRLHASVLPVDRLRGLCEGSPGLTHLTLERLSIDWDELARWLDSPAAPGLESLDATTRRADSIAPLAGALGRRALRNLRLDSPLDPGAVGSLVDSGAFREVESLVITGADATHGLEGLAKASFPRLSSLTLDRCGLTSATLAALAPAPWLGQLRVLELPRNRLSNDAAAALLMRELPRLRRLVLPAAWPEESPLLELLLRRGRAPNLRQLVPPPPAARHLRAFLEGTAPPLQDLHLAGSEAEVLRALDSPRAHDVVRLAIETPTESAAVRTALESSPALAHLEWVGAPFAFDSARFKVANFEPVTFEDR